MGLTWTMDHTHMGTAQHRTHTHVHVPKEAVKDIIRCGHTKVTSSPLSFSLSHTHMHGRRQSKSLLPYLQSGLSSHRLLFRFLTVLSFSCGNHSDSPPSSLSWVCEYFYTWKDSLDYVSKGSLSNILCVTQIFMLMTELSPENQNSVS